MFTFAESSTLAGITTKALMLSPDWSKKRFTFVVPGSPRSGMKRNCSLSEITPDRRPVSSITVTVSSDELAELSLEVSTGIDAIMMNRNGTRIVITINDLRATSDMYSRCMMSRSLFIV